MTALWIILGIIAVLAFMVIGMYNSLIKLRNQVKNAWAQIDVQLKRRHDLIPNLIETVRGYMIHERQTLESITNMRSQAMNATNMQDRVKAEGELTNMLGRLQVAVEAYPDLKANQNFLALQEELTSTENKISYARQSYNDQVLFYNNKKQIFPSNIIAGMFNFKDEVFFEIQDQSEKEVPKVSF
ncbi:MAG TPA: LemA family protein [Bacteroidales bacterium]|nr:LemA family protein [Bacteroidales bacterium]HNZ42682.1 LemA family protein [Bacteroidales bacterium]HOH84482.1 LemA family protein [Bacteroidales bacterium]HPB25468.1 LemA family protein [Bacteroidales bacterium]HPI29597.1 LemA family protein [Bacteroidales bacterium]